MARQPEQVRCRPAGPAGCRANRNKTLYRLRWALACRGRSGPSHRPRCPRCRGASCADPAERLPHAEHRQGRWSASRPGRRCRPMAAAEAGDQPPGSCGRSAAAPAGDRARQGSGPVAIRATPERDRGRRAAAKMLGPCDGAPDVQGRRTLRGGPSPTSCQEWPGWSVLAHRLAAGRRLPPGGTRAQPGSRPRLGTPACSSTASRLGAWLTSPKRSGGLIGSCTKWR